MRFKKREKKAGGSLRYVSLGGTGEVNKNMHLYEYKGQILVVDCGIDFPDSETPGVDVVIPDFSYLDRKENRAVGVVVTHGHEDHFGALPYLLSHFSVPIYATKLVRGFIAAKLEEFRLDFKPDLRLINPDGPDGGVLKLGPFTLTPFRINHSVPDSIGLSIETPMGKIFHVADFKFDWTPVMDKPFDIQKLVGCARGEVRALFSDCLGSTSEGYTRSEKDIEEVFDQLISEAAGQVFVTTISSNISRIQQAINVSLHHGRKICFLGRSVEKNSQVAKILGYLKVPKKMVLSPPRSLDFPSSEITYIIAGCYGQPNSALTRVSKAEHRLISLKRGATVIFSGDPAPPGTKDNVDSLVDRLISLGADVYYYDIQENLHTSGHGSKRELEMLAALIRPTYFIPIGGTMRHMQAYTKIIEAMGFPPENVFSLQPGRFLSFSKRGARLGETFSLNGVYIDGSGVGDIGGQVLRERQIMANDGLVVLNLPLKGGKLSGKIQVSSRGFTKGDKTLFSQIEKRVKGIVKGGVSLENKHPLVKKIKREVGKVILKEIARRPLIVVTFVPYACSEAEI